MNCQIPLPTCPPAAAILLLGGFLVCSTAWADEPTPDTQSPPVARNRASPKHTTKSLRGRVVWLAEALARLHGVKTVPEAADRVLALETPEGRLVPLIEDKRGHSFRLDERLRDIDVELLVRQYEGSPQIQVIQIFALKDDGKYELDYWCEICAIAMFELKPCDCCQADIELRERLVPPKE